MIEFNLLGEIENTTVNGPGERYMIHLQGCPLKCPGCFNPESWHFKKNKTVNVYELAEKILSYDRDGLSISGGEPMMQAPALLNFLRFLHSQSKSPFRKGILMYSGFYEEELLAIPEYQEILQYMSVIISGRYKSELRVYDSLISSSNQKFIFGGQKLIDHYELMGQKFEIVFNEDQIKLTGFPPLNMKELADFGVKTQVF